MKRRPDCRDRKSANSPASRARCLKPTPPDPRWPYPFRAARFEDRDQRLTTAAGPRHVWAVGTAGTTCRQKAPVAHGWCAGTGQLRLPGGGVRLCTLIPRPPPPVPASVTFGRDFPWRKQVADYIAECRVIV